MENSCEVNRKIADTPKTIQKYIELIADALRPKRTISELLLSTGTGQGRSVPEVAHRLLKLAPRLLSAKNLISGVSKCLQQNGGEAATLRDTYSSILQQTLGLAQHFHDQKPGEAWLLCTELVAPN